MIREVKIYLLKRNNNYEKKLIKTSLTLLFSTFLANNANASDNGKELQDLKTQLQDLKVKITKIEDENKKQKDLFSPFKFGNNSFNPQIGVVLNGKYINSTNDNDHN
jgi:cell shape-determining protein MreC